MTVNERVNFLIAELEHGNKSAFAEKIGSKGGVIGDIVGGRLNKPSFGVLEKIAATYKSVNAEWLLTGEGEPFRQNAPVGNNISGIKIKGSGNATGNYAQAGTADLQAEVERLRMENGHLKQRLKDKEELIEILKLQGKNTQTKPSP